MKTDVDLKYDVEAELRWDASIDPTDIAVSVNNGIVALTGFVHSAYEQREAELVVKRITGVHGVANDLVIRLTSADQRSDPEIARDAVNALKAQVTPEWENITVTVKSGWITLEGQVGWDFTRRLAETAVRRVRGLKGLSNVIRLHARAEVKNVKQKIEEAFQRNAEVDAQRVNVEVKDGKVTLNGTVRTWREWDEAQRAAWNAPGVTHVENHLGIS